MLDSFNIICPCGYQDPHNNTKLIIECTSCKSYQHKYCMKSMVKMTGYQCPYCQLKKGALFFNILYSLIDPTLIEFNPSNKNLNAWLNFIPDFSVYGLLTKKNLDSPIAIIVRCLRLDKDGFSFHWPKMSKIYINNKLVLDLTKKGSKHRDKMITLITEKDFENEQIKKKYFFYDSNMIKVEDYLIEQKPNRIQVSLDVSEEENYEYKSFIISLDLCEILNTTESLINSVPIIKNKNEIKKIIINNENEKNILSLKEKISLLDIYTETDKIKIPVRGKNCCHLNVFDLETFLIMNRKTNKFQCPYCKRNSNDLYIDGIIYDFIKDSNNENIEEIFLDKDLNISLEESPPISEMMTNSNSNDETSKTEIKKIVKKPKKEKEPKKSIKNNKQNITKKIEKNEKHNYHYLRGSDVIHITDSESESENINENENNDINIINNNNKKEKKEESDKNDLISDLGHVFDNIRKDIISKSKKIYDKNYDRKNKSCSRTSKSKKHNYKSNIDLGVKKQDDITVSCEKNKLKLKFENPFNKVLTKKRKRISYNWNEKMDSDYSYSEF